MKSMVVLFGTLLIPSTLFWRCPSRPIQNQTDVKTSSKNRGNERAWHAGTFRGLTPGKSTIADVLGVLGAPQRQETPADQTSKDANPEVWYVYDGAAEFRGEMTVIIATRSNVVERIDLAPEDLSKEQAIKHFGGDYVLTRYAFDECLGDEESAPVYESANGPLLEMEYRQRGIAISVTASGKVNRISYVSKPLGPTQSKCNPSRKQARPL